MSEATLAEILAARQAYQAALVAYQSAVCRAVLAEGLSRGEIARAVGVRTEVISRMVKARSACGCGPDGRCERHRLADYRAGQETAR